MERLNYNRLQHFWAVGKEGSVTRAALLLGVSQPAVSAQVRALEKELGEKLLRKSGRTLALTDVGQLVYRYADEIFGLGRELAETVRGQPGERPLRLNVGMVQALPKLVVYHLVAPALRLDRPVRLTVLEDRPDKLFADLALHTLDLVLSDAPLPGPLAVKAYNHPLGDCGISILAAPRLAARYRDGFPAALNAAPFLLPTPNTALRQAMDRWFESNDVRPTPVAELEDSAVLKVFGQEGAGLIAIPSVVEAQVCRQYDMELVGRIDEIRERFYAISAERRIVHPAVVAITQAARSSLFTNGSG